MRVALIPLHTLPTNPATNRREVETRLTQIALGNRIWLCLPECALTGYSVVSRGLGTLCRACAERFGGMVRKNGEEEFFV